MKETRLHLIPRIERMRPFGGIRFYYNFTKEGEQNTADFVTVGNLTKAEVVIAMISEKYTKDDELAIHRKKLANEAPEEFDEYNTFVNSCKNEADSYFVKPTESSLKGEIQEWLTLNHVAWESTMLKAELLNLVK